MSSKDELKIIFGIVGSITSSLIYLSPIIPFYNILKNELKYKKYPGLVLMLSLMNCILWTVYGLKIDDKYIYISNTIGGIFLLVWITIYLFFLSKKNFKLSGGFNVFLLISITFIMSLFYFMVPEEGTGIAATFFNLLLYVMPVKNILKVIDKTNIKYIPIFSAILGLVNSSCWIIYAICSNEYNKYYKILIAQGVGFVLGIFQIIIYIMYYFKYKDKRKKRALSEN